MWRSANLVAKTVFLAVGLVILLGMVWWFGAPRTDYATGVGVVVDQPVPFSHEHHVTGLGIDCRFCHISVETASTAGMPPTYTCMTCHSQIWTNAALLEPVRQSLADHKPINWNRVNSLPDYVYFNHSIHVAKGVGCQECHGHVGRGPLSLKAQPFSMKFCLDCHRDPAPHLRPAADEFDTEWTRKPETPSPAALMMQYHLGGRSLTDCSICHR